MPKLTVTRVTKPTPHFKVGRHIVTYDNGAVCTCGRKGCRHVEAVREWLKGEKK